MSDGKRPGGLTALAVLNFVFGGLGAIGFLLLFAALGVTDQASGGQVTAELNKQPGAGIAWVQILLSLATVVLMIAAGVGYLGQKRFLGRTLGNAYAVVSLVYSAVAISIAGIGIFAIIGLVYPVLTLMLINTTFKDDLVN